MKILILFIFIFFIAFSGCNSASTSVTSPSSAAAVTHSFVTKTEFHVKGMHCTGCENTIKASVNELKGIASVEASYKDNKAVVAFDSTKTNEVAIVAAIEDAGYKVDTFLRK